MVARTLVAGGPDAQGQADAVELPVRRGGPVALVHAALAPRRLRAVHPRHRGRPQSAREYCGPTGVQSTAMLTNRNGQSNVFSSVPICR